MGTNYYWNANPCPHCGRADDALHIGKSSAGWTFTFHATDEIRSFADWKRVFEANGYITDEYGERHLAADFIKMVEGKAFNDWNHARDVHDPASEYSKYEQALHRHYRVRPNDGTDFLDAEGHSFSAHEFS